jgi:hypothetical protein
MSKTNDFENAVLNLIFKNQALPNIGDASGLQPAGTVGSFWIALTTNTPTDAAAGTQMAYTGYARAQVDRNTGWTVSLGQAVNSAPITFPPCTGNAQTAAGFEIYTAITGGDRLYWGVLNIQLVVAIGVTPEFSTGALVVLED